MKKYRFYTDAGHGWMAVKRKELVALNILDKITSCSYQKGKTVYLEEDCDLTTFVEAKEAAGQKINKEDVICIDNDYSPIRNYPQFTI